jgi:hypothetical protein
MTTQAPVIVWDYARLAALAEIIERNISTMNEPDGLRTVYNAGRRAVDPHTRRAWAEVAPAAGLRVFGYCRQVNELRELAAADLARLIGPEIPNT